MTSTQLTRHAQRSIPNASIIVDHRAVTDAIHLASAAEFDPVAPTEVPEF
jgi:hypothetical protein